MEDNDTTSIIFNYVDGKQKKVENELCAEDLAWVDSCLIEDPEISETNLDSLKAALLDIIDHSEIFGPTANKQDDSNDVTDPKKSPLVIKEENSDAAETSSGVSLSLMQQAFYLNNNDEMMKTQYAEIFGPSANKPDKSDDVTDPKKSPLVIEQENSDGAESSSGVSLSLMQRAFLPDNKDEMMKTRYAEIFVPSANKPDESNDVTDPKKSPPVIEEQNSDGAESSSGVSLALKQQPFLPNYNDEMINNQYADSDVYDVDGFKLMEASSSDIFKVWDLGFMVEEDELFNEWMAALAVPKENPLILESIDSLIEGIADLSLK